MKKDNDDDDDDDDDDVHVDDDGEGDDDDDKDDGDDDDDDGDDDDDDGDDDDDDDDKHQARERTAQAMPIDALLDSLSQRREFCYQDSWKILIAVVLFFPSNARWLLPGRLSSRKDNCILQIHRIKAVATSVMTTMTHAYKRELNRIDT